MYVYISKALHLLFFPNFPGPMSIPCPTSIPEARVISKLDIQKDLCKMQSD